MRTSPTPEQRYDDAISRIARGAYRHCLLAGAETSIDRKDPEAFDKWHQHSRAAHEGLAAVMVLRRVRAVAPELLPDLLEQMDLASLIGEFGLHIQLARHLEDAGGSPDVVVQEVTWTQEREVKAA